jgi:hypothetical protein
MDQLGRLFRRVFGPSILYYQQRKEQMRLANKEKTVRYENDKGEWILVRGEITKKEHMDLTRELNPSAESRTVGDFYDMFEKFFQLVMLDWSLVDEKDNPMPPTLQLYYDLNTESAGQIDEWLNKHMQEKFGREVEELEGEATS